MVIDHPLYKYCIGINMNFYFGTFTQKDVAIYIAENEC
jgi:hypothetical protein